MSGTASPDVSTSAAPLRRAQFTPSEAWPYAVLLIAAIALPFTGANDYWILLATRMAIYTVLIMGLNLVVGFAGQLALGYVGLLTVGAYTSSVLVEKLGVGVFPALAVAAVAGAAFGALLSVPALRAANVLLRHDDHGLRHHRLANRAGVAIHHRRRQRNRRAGLSRPARHRKRILPVLPRAGGDLHLDDAQSRQQPARQVAAGGAGRGSRGGHQRR